MSKAQIQSQIFVYIAAIIIVGMIIILGIRVISSVSKNASNVESKQFQQSFTNNINSGTSYGDRNTVNYDLPKGIDTLCVVDLEHVNASDIIDQPLVRDSVESGVRQNVFLIGKNKFSTFYVENLRIKYPYYYQCYQSTQGSIEPQIEGVGNAALVNMPATKIYCERAQQGDTDICNILDIVYWQGYRDSCCSKYQLCCAT